MALLVNYVFTRSDTVRIVHSSTRSALFAICLINDGRKYR